MPQENAQIQRVLISPEYTGELPTRAEDLELIKVSLLGGGSQQIVPEGQDMDRR